MSEDEHHDLKFDDSKFDDLMEYINASDPLQIIIRSHLIIEAKLISLIELRLKHKDEIDVARLRFPTKVDLASALGCISEKQVKSMLLKINSLRNKFAHDLNYQINEKDISGIYKDSPLEYVIDSEYEEREELDKLRAIFALVYLLLDDEESRIKIENDPTNLF